MAIGSVVLFHYNMPFFNNGFLGVDIFFVISGFLITSIIYNEVMAGEFTYTKFYARRFRRILPALICVVIATTVIAYSILPPLELKRYALTAIGSITGTSNFIFFNFVDYFSPTADKQLLLMTWSLGIEEQFYILFPPLIVLLASWKRGAIIPIILLITALSLICAVGMNAYRPDAAFYLIPFRAWELGVGSLLAVSRATDWSKRLTSIHHEIASLAALSSIAIAIVINADAPIVLLNLMAVLGTAIFILSGKSSINRFILSSRVFVGIGLISYSWYLWHWLPASLMHILQIKLDLLTRTGLIFATLLAGVASYYLVEKPFRKSSGGDTALVRRYAVLVALVLAPLGIVVATSGLAALSPARLRAVEADIKGSFGNPCLAPYGVSVPKLNATCLPKSDKSALALIGDSHANAIAQGAKMLADSKSMAFYQFTKSSCPPLSGITRYMPNHKGHDDECSQYMKTVIETVEKHPEISVIILAGYWAASFDEESDGFRYIRTGSDGRTVTIAESRENLTEGLNQTISLLENLGRKVIVMQDVPRFTVDPYTKALAQIVPLRGWLSNVAGAASGSTESEQQISTSQVKEDTARSIVTQVVERHPSTTLFDPYSHMCDNNGCVFQDDKHVFYGDSQHLSTSGARYLAQYFPAW